MINQVTNLIQWKNLSKEDQAGFDFERYKYEWQSETIWESVNWAPLKPNSNGVYRLVIQPDKFYYMEGENGTEIIKGGSIDNRDRKVSSVIRPATSAEMPKPATLEDRVVAEYKDFEVSMLEWNGSFLDYICEGVDFPHTQAQSMRGFYKYVYEFGDFLSISIDPTTIHHYGDGEDETITPIAALFVRGEA